MKRLLIATAASAALLLSTASMMPAVADSGPQTTHLVRSAEDFSKPSVIKVRGGYVQGYKCLANDAAGNVYYGVGPSPAAALTIAYNICVASGGYNCFGPYNQQCPYGTWWVN